MARASDLLASLSRLVPAPADVDEVSVAPDPWDVIERKLAEVGAPNITVPAPQVRVDAPDLSELLAALEAGRFDAQAFVALLAAALPQPTDSSEALREVVTELVALRKKLNAVVAGSGGGSASASDMKVNGQPVSTTNPVPTVSADAATAEPTVVVATVTASGDTTIHTPAAGMRVRLEWVSAINDPDEATNPLIKILLGADEKYRAYAVAHRETFTGAVDAPLVVNLSGVASVAVTAHLVEV